MTRLIPLHYRQILLSPRHLINPPQQPPSGAHTPPPASSSDGCISAVPNSGLVVRCSYWSCKLFGNFSVFYSGTFYTSSSAAFHILSSSSASYTSTESDNTQGVTEVTRETSAIARIISINHFSMITFVT